MKDYSNHFRELVKHQLGDDPRILVPRGAQDMMILATWRLSGDTPSVTWPVGAGVLND
jgi:hypothetical protein